jgi:hypothetical protein
MQYAYFDCVTFRRVGDVPNEVIGTCRKGQTRSRGSSFEERAPLYSRAHEALLLPKKQKPPAHGFPRAGGLHRPLNLSGTVAATRMVGMKKR